MLSSAWSLLWPYLQSRWLHPWCSHSMYLRGSFPSTGLIWSISNYDQVCPFYPLWSSQIAFNSLDLKIETKIYHFWHPADLIHFCCLVQSCGLHHPWVPMFTPVAPFSIPLITILILFLLFQPEILVNSRSSFTAQRKQVGEEIFPSPPFQHNLSQLSWLYTHRTTPISLTALKLAQSYYIFMKVNFWLMSFSSSRLQAPWRAEMVFLLHCIPSP